MILRMQQHRMGNILANRSTTLQRCVHTSMRPLLSVNSPAAASRSSQLTLPISTTRYMRPVSRSFFTTAATNQPNIPTNDSTPSTSPPLPFAVVGSGPAAFYTTKYLLREFPNCRIDMFERLPVPYGLVRYGVAPDHPDVKSVTNDFAQVSNDSRFAFWGNVEIGKELQLEQLRQHYAGVILAYGAASERTLNIPGSHLKGIHPSRHFVNWSLDANNTLRGANKSMDYHLVLVPSL